MMTQAEFPTEGVALTHLLVVSDLPRSRHFYRDVPGATIYREYGGTSCVLNFQGSWLLLVTGGGPTDDKPTITFAPPEDRGEEVRCFFRDPDGHFLEISQAVQVKVSWLGGSVVSVGAGVVERWGGDPCGRPWWE